MPETKTQTDPIEAAQPKNPHEVTLKKGLKIGETIYKTVMVRETTVDDLIEAEEEAPAYKSVAYRCALTARVMSVQGFSGVVTAKMLSRLTAADYQRIQERLYALDDEGNAEG